MSRPDDEWVEVPVSDEWEEIPVAAPPPRSKTTLGMSALRGAAQGASGGWADELTATIGGAIDAATGPLDYGTAREGWLSAIRRADKKASDDNPVTYGASQVGGGVASAFVPGMQVGSIGKAAALGAATGAGNSEADPTKNWKELKMFAGDTALGGVLGAGMQKATNVAGPLLKKGVEKGSKIADDLAERWAFKAAAGGQQKAYDEAVRQGTVNKIGRDLLDDGVVSFGANARNIAERAGDAKSATGEEIGALLKRLDTDAAAPLGDGTRIAGRIREYAKSIDAPNNAPLVQKLLKQADEFEGMGGIPLQRAQELKNSYRWDPRDPAAMPLGKDATNKLKMIMGSEIDDGVEAAGRMAPRQAVEEAATGTGAGSVQTFPGSAVYKQADAVDDVLGQYAGLKSKYGSMSTAKGAAEKLANRQEKNRLFSLSDYLSGLAIGGATMNPLTGAAVAGANKMARERGPAAAAVTLDKLGSLLQQAPDKLGKFAPVLQRAADRGSLPVVHHLLMKNDPEYRSLVSGE